MMPLLATSHSIADSIGGPLRQRARWGSVFGLVPLLAAASGCGRPESTPPLAAPPSLPSGSETAGSRPRLTRFPVGRHQGFVIEPAGPIDGQRRWLWFASCWHAIPQDPARRAPYAGPDDSVTHRFYVAAALERGFHVGGVDVGVTCGSPAGIAVCQEFYAIVIRDLGLNHRVRLVAQSNGGLIHYNWAARHPACVDRILGIFPVTDMRLWPGLEAVEEHITDPELRYGLTVAELSDRLAEFNPIDQLRPLADHGVRILHVHGDADATVPLAPHSLALQRRYAMLGGRAEIELVSGAGHAGGPAFYESPRALAFLLE